MESKMQNEESKLQNQDKEKPEFRDEESAFITKETVVEEMAIDGICGVY